MPVASATLPTTESAAGAASAQRLAVLHVSTETGWRGGEQQVAHLTRGLATRGHRVIVACPSNGRLFGELREATEADAGGSGELAGRLEVVALRASGGWDLGAARRVANLASQRGADIVHAHTSHAHGLAWLAAAMPSWMGGMGENGPRVMVSRRVDFGVGRSWLGRLKYGSPRLRYIAISEAVARVLREGGVEPSRIDVAWSGVDPMRFGGPRNECRAAPGRDDYQAALWGAEPGTPLLLNVAALVGHKDQANLLRACAILRDKLATRASVESRENAAPDRAALGREEAAIADRSGVEGRPAAPGRLPFRLVIAGEGNLRGRLEMLRDELGLRRLVEMPGQLNGAQLRGLYQGADLFVLSSQLEGLGTAMLDALAVGLPVVATEVGGVPECVMPGRTGWLARARDPEALAAALAEALGNPDARGRVAAEGPRLVAERFTHDAMVEGTLAAYRRALAR